MSLSPVANRYAYLPRLPSWNNKIRITLWATYLVSRQYARVSLVVWGLLVLIRFVLSAVKAPRLGQPDGSTRPALIPPTDVVPLADNTYDIGTSSLRWRSIYGVSGVFGTDPGGTESLRAGSARLNAPVLLGSVPQFTMAADPTAALQVATKQYADTKLARDTAETITARHTFNPSTTGAPFLVGTNASGQLVTGLNADQVDGQHLADLDARFVNASGDSMSGALVVGDDPGGSEVLRAQSLRAGSGRIGSWRILGVIQPTSNVTSVQFSGLNLSPPVVLRLVMVVRNPTSTRTFLELRVNGETNSSDWAFQYVSGQGVTVAAGRITDASDIAWVSAGFTGTASCTICVGPSGAVIANSTVSDASGTDTPIVNTYSTMKNTTITSLSSIEIVSSVTNGIASGSVFYLEYLAP
jgi:hypothetical protein